ncbi:hypothetical protein FB645_003688 [Coemansia sp. IMI 203386]|nr:hypothetical protein FB645_003688 [Coemansia sp. IMI 203386]
MTVKNPGGEPPNPDTQENQPTAARLSTERSANIPGTTTHNDVVDVHNTTRNKENDKQYIEEEDDDVVNDDDEEEEEDDEAWIDNRPVLNSSSTLNTSNTKMNQQPLQSITTNQSSSADSPAGGDRAQSPRSARRLRNRLAAARMRTRQKQHLEELEKRKEQLELKAAELENELRLIQRKNNPLNASIDKLAEMIDDLTKVEFTMLSGIDECKGLLQNLEKIYHGQGSNSSSLDM